jgi:hypothetical protein
MVHGTGGGSNEVTETHGRICSVDTSDDEYELLCLIW